MRRLRAKSPLVGAPARPARAYTRQRLPDPMPALAEPDDDHDHSRALRRELYLFALYRMLEASLLALVVFSPVGALIGEMHLPDFARVLAVAYLLLSTGLLLRARTVRTGIAGHAVAGTALDILVAGLATHAMPGAGPGIALMLVFNVGAVSLFLSLRGSVAMAAVAALSLIGEYAWDGIEFDTSGSRPFAEVLMFAVGYFAVAALIHHLGRQMRATQRLADRRGAEAANLAEINELVIRRMRTGVMLVDGRGHVRMANEAAQLLLSNDDDAQEHALHGRTLAQIAPELALRLAEWLRDGQQNEEPLVYGADQAEVLPRFARLLANSDTTLIFLDDTSMLSRRAESITLAAMGRFSASLAHEIRNPLAAISYATQLLEESHDLTTADRRLLQIIHQQCLRTNGIVESVLGLARRERAKPEHIDLVIFIRGFIDDYRMIVPEDNAQLRMTGRTAPLPVMFDPRHLQQILTALVNNAVRYGHMPGEKPRIAIHLEETEQRPVISVLDRGPGIPDAVVAQLFRPFFTTSENGTGLGLYIANELSRANEATLDYVAVPGGGACFRLVLPAQHALMSG